MNIVLIHNSASGSSRNILHLRSLFKHHGVHISYSFNVKQLDSHKLRSLIKQGNIIAAYGGDGTLNAVASLIVNTKSTLLPLPGGTFNHFVRYLGMSLALEDTLQKLSSSKTRMIDVGYVNERLFLNNSNIGLYPFSLVQRKATKKYVGKWVAAALTAIDQIARFRRHRLIVDGIRLRSPFIFIGNNVYDIESALIPRRISFSKGVLTVMIATTASRRGLLRSIIAVLRGDISRDDQFDVTTPKILVIDSPKRTSIPVSFDGEVADMSFPLTYRVEPKCLRVMTVK